MKENLDDPFNLLENYDDQLDPCVDGWQGVRCDPEGESVVELYVIFEVKCVLLSIKCTC